MHAAAHSADVAQQQAQRPDPHAGAAVDAACRDLAGLLRANINPVSLLATDYLNHFNEAVMLLALVPDMPEMLEDAKRWAPKAYQQHFRDSSFAAKDLVCAAYDRSPERFRVPFDLTVRTIERRILGATADIAATLAIADAERLHGIVETHCTHIRQLIATAAALVNGSTVACREAGPTTPVPAAAPARAPETLSQDAIDALFR